MTDNIECTTCGEPATHLYATFNVADGTIGSINGRGRWSPSCDSCDEPDLVEVDTDVFRIEGAIEMWPHLPR